MSINPIIFFDLVITIAILALTIIVLIILFLKSLRKSYLQHEKDENNDAIAASNSSSLEEARSKAVKIIDRANNKAMDIIQKANLFITVRNDSFNKELKDITQKELKMFEEETSGFIKVYEDVLNDLKSRNVEIFQNISKDIEISTLEEIKKFKYIIEQETIASQEMISKKINHEYSLAKKDIETYKQSQLIIVDERIYQILEKVSTLVMGKAISLSDHEALVIDSLEKAKKEAIFDSTR